MRQSIEEWAIGIATAIGVRSTCDRRQVGCVLLSEGGFVIGEGYNDSPAGLPNCYQMEVHTDPCWAVHAEINALIKCTRPNEIHTVAVTAFPCFNCLKAILNTPMKKLVYSGVYSGYNNTVNMQMLDIKGIKLIHID